MACITSAWSSGKLGLNFIEFNENLVPSLPIIWKRQLFLRKPTTHLLRKNQILLLGWSRDTPNKRCPYLLNELALPQLPPFCSHSVIKRELQKPQKVLEIC